MPGAQLGILRYSPEGDDELVTTSYGVLNNRTGATVTDESLFQIGSISKVWTATVAMQLVDEGLLELDGPIVEVLPDLRLADPDVTKSVTLRHLLTHTSGIDGDVFTDTGRGDDCLEKYVDLLADAAQNHPLGATWSYCNSGYSLLGRLIEKVTGMTWDEAHARAALHAARPDPHGHAARGGAALRRRRRPRRGRGRAGHRARVAAAPLARPGRPDHRHRRRRARASRGCT